MNSQAFSRQSPHDRFGHKAAGDELVQTVYDELRRLAGSYLRQERKDHTLQPTALVHEAYLRLSEQEAIVWQSREHFIGVAATMMRRILVNHAIKRKRTKRGGGVPNLSLAEADKFFINTQFDIVALDAALERLSSEFPLEAQIVDLKFFGGLSIKDTARILSVSDTTVERSWRFARAWLLRELNG
jgi:RNA polymerase sigma-70 factor (ECF subfamily)